MDGYCETCGEPSDEPDPEALCAYHRDFPDNDPCECSEYYRHRGAHTPGCPADDGEVS